MLPIVHRRCYNLKTCMKLFALPKVCLFVGHFMKHFEKPLILSKCTAYNSSSFASVTKPEPILNVHYDIEFLFVLHADNFVNCLDISFRNLFVNFFVVMANGSNDVGFDAEFFKSTDGVFKVVQLVSCWFRLSNVKKIYALSMY